MVSIGFDNMTSKYFVKFNGVAFHECLEIVKNAKMKYDSSYTRWIGTPKKLIEVYDKLENVDIVNTVNWESVLLNKNNYGELETQFKRVKLNEDCLLSPPIKGKHPYEDFQIECIKKGISQNRYAFFLGMGSGKTYVTISVLNHWFIKDSLEGVIVVTPPEGVYNWREELKMFSLFAKTNDYIIISTATNNRDPFETGKQFKVVIMTYRHFVTLSDDYYAKTHKKKVKKYRKPTIPFDWMGENLAIVIDESHSIKNTKSRQRYLINLHKSYFKYRYLLTGTPTPNSFEEIFTQMLFLDGGILPSNYFEWLEDIANLGGRFSKYKINYLYPEKVKKWEIIFSKWVTRYTSDEILDLPALYIVDTFAEMTKKQKDIYEKLINYRITVLREKEGRIIPRSVFNSFPYISQAYENASLLVGKIDPSKSKDLYKLVNNFNFVKDHGKMEIVDALLKKYLGEGLKVTIADFHPLTLDTLAEIYKEYNPIVIHGQNVPPGVDKVQFRNEQLELFKNDPDRMLLITSSTVLRTAVNIVECKRIINFSRSYDYTTSAQFMKRFHRFKQNDPVILHNMIFTDSLDVRLDEALKRKKDLDSSIFNKESIAKGKWKDIFKGR